MKRFIVMSLFLCTDLMAYDLNTDPQREDTNLQNEQTQGLQFTEDKNLQQERTNDIQFRADPNLEQEQTGDIQFYEDQNFRQERELGRLGFC